MRHSFFFLLAYCLIQLSYSQNATNVYTKLERYYSQNELELCIKTEDEFESFSKNKTDTVVANGYFYLADAHLQLGKITKAIYYFEREKTIRAQLGQQNTEDYGNVLYNLAHTYIKAGLYKNAETTADALLAHDKEITTPTDDVYVTSVLSVSDLYITIDRLKNAETLLIETIKQQPKGSANRAKLLNKIGDLYTYKGEYSKASKVLSESLLIIEKMYGQFSPEHISAIVRMGSLYMSQGKYAQAEEAFDIALDVLNPADDAYMGTLNNQGLVYRSLGQYQRAEKLFTEIKQVDSATIGTTHPDYAITLANLAVVQTDEAKYAQAESNFLQSMSISKVNKETKTISYARTITSLARMYQLAGNPAKAIPLLIEASDLFKRVLGKNSPEFATALFNLGMAHWKSGKGETGISFLKESARIRLATLGKNHPKYAESMQKIAEYQWSKKEYKEARQSFGEVFNNYYYQIHTFFPVLTEEEKARFYYNNIRPTFSAFHSFAVETQSINSGIIEELYNHQINTKSVIMMATEKVRQGILAMNDPLLNEQYEEWKAIKEQLAKQYSQNQSLSIIDSLAVRADQLEKYLTRRSSDFAAQYITKKYIWTEVQQRLKQGQAAVEVIRYNSYSPKNGGYSTDDIHYAFLVITNQTKQPELILLQNGEELEKKYLNFYRNSIKFQLTDEISFKKYIEPLVEYLKNNSIHEFYFSPEGIFNQININTIYNPSTHNFIIDEFNIHHVTTTRELIDNTDKYTVNKAILMGFPSFNLSGTSRVSDVETTRSMGLTRGFRGGLLRYMRSGTESISVLPGTQKEIQEIASLFSAQPKIYMKTEAAEHVLKSVDNPSILHIATHGYFLDDEQETQTNATHYVANPLLKAGLILAGAENFLTTGIALNEAGDDGILTAYEALNLRLDNTNLVVLSACETGLGKLRNGEGVYGLQRAFKLAGAQSIVMSLWSVDDTATQELMSLFYKEMMKGTDQREAFRTAQKRLKEKFSSPFYWGAFVMAGI